MAASVSKYPLPSSVSAPLDEQRPFCEKLDAKSKSFLQEIVKEQLNRMSADTDVLPVRIL